jgi:uncharacterized membrane protein YadS
MLNVVAIDVYKNKIKSYKKKKKSVPWNIIFFIIVFLLVWIGLLDEYQVRNIGLVEVLDLSASRK